MQPRKASYAGLTRVSIHLRKNLSKAMDCRVIKPGNDGFVVIARSEATKQSSLTAWLWIASLRSQ
jgi:hypothetical protein